MASTVQLPATRLTGRAERLGDISDCVINIVQLFSKTSSPPSAQLEATEVTSTLAAIHWNANYML